MLILCILMCTLNTGSKCTKSSSNRFLFLPKGFAVVEFPFPLGVGSYEGRPERVDVYGDEADEGVEPEAG
jgi:hypothetical protein